MLAMDEVIVRAKEIDESIEYLRAEREVLFSTVAKDLAESGVEVVITDCYHSRASCTTRCRHDVWTVGDRADVVTCYGDYRETSRPHVDANFLVSVASDLVFVNRGTFQLVMIHEPLERHGNAEMTWVKVADVDDETFFRRATSNVRARARRQGMRVRARDRRISLIAPTNEVVHEGDAISCTMWLMGLTAGTNGRAAA